MGVLEQTIWVFQDFAFLPSSLESTLIVANQNQNPTHHAKHQNVKPALIVVMDAINVHFVLCVEVAQVASVISVNTAKMVQLDARKNAKKEKILLSANPALEIVLEISEIKMK